MTDMDSDPLRPARGIALGVTIGLGMWLAAVELVVTVL